MYKKERLRSDTQQRLLSAAIDARKQAYAPYSGFEVGAAVLTESGEVYTGCNIENASYSATICAERVAVTKAICAGHRSITALALVADYPEPLSPCGICRQVLVEFGPEAEVIMANTKGKVRTTNMNELLPHAFVLAVSKRDK